MKKLIVLFALLISANAIGAESLYQSDFSTPAGRNKWVKYRTGFEHMSVWGFAKPGDVYQLSHDYPVMGSETDTVKDWIVSPLVKFSTGKVKVNFNFFSMMGTTRPEDKFQIMISRGSKNPADGDYVLFADLTSFTGGWDEYMDKEFDLSPETISDSCYFAFYYQATMNWVVPTIRSLSVDGTYTDVVERGDEPGKLVNLKGGTLESQIENPDGSHFITIYNMHGAIIDRFGLNEEVNRVALAYVPGSYFYALSSSKGVIEKGAFILSE